jgi:hypothetical protein
LDLKGDDMTDTQEAELRRKAERRADAKLAFRGHLTAYLVINAGLVALNLLTSPDTLWFYWPMLGWGIGLVAHGVTTYTQLADARDDLIEAELQRLRARQR